MFRHSTTVHVMLTGCELNGCRNRVLDIANQSSPRPVFTLMLSADETVQNAHDLRQFLLRNLYSFGNAHGAYPVSSPLSIAIAVVLVFSVYIYC